MGDREGELIGPATEVTAFVSEIIPEVREVMPAV
jgi:hypothetical protein